MATPLSTSAGGALAADLSPSSVVPTGGSQSFALPDVAAAALSGGSASAGLAAEIERAEAAEGVLTSGLATETAARVAGDGANSSAIASEATTRATADTANANAIAAETARAEAAEALLAPLNSPSFTNTPSAPTAAPGTNTTQLATTAFTQAAVAAEAAARLAAVGATVAPLSGGVVPLANLPASVIGSVHYAGTWNAATNIPALVSSTSPGGTAPVGKYYVVATPGTTTIDGNSTWNLGDWIIWNGTVWERLGSSSVTGLGGAAFLNVGTTTGTVADGGVAAANTAAIAAEVTRAEAAEEVLTSGLASETAARVAGDAANSSAIASEATTRAAADTANAAAAAAAQATANAALPASQLGAASGAARLDANATLSANTVEPAGATVPVTLAQIVAWGGINPMLFGAKYDLQIANCAVTCTTGSDVLVFGASLFSAADVGKSFQVVLPETGGLVCSGTITAGSGTSMTSSAAPLQNVTVQTVVVMWGTDDSAAHAAAINYANSIAPYRNTKIKHPVGGSYIKSTAMPVVASVSVGIEGEGDGQTIFVLDPAYPGNFLFAWSQCNGQAVGNVVLTTISTTLNSLVSIGKFTIVGNLGAPGPVHGIVFYDHCCFMDVHDVTAFCLPGSIIQTGRLYASGNTTGALCESKIDNIRGFQCGITTAANLDLFSQGTGQSTNELVINRTDFFKPGGHAWSLTNSCSTNSLEEIKGGDHRVEAVPAGYAAVYIGTSALQAGLPNANVTNINLRGWEINALGNGSYGFLINGTSDATVRQNIALKFEGNIISTHTGCIPVQVNNGDQINFDMMNFGGAVNISNCHGTVQLDGMGATSASTVITVTNPASPTLPNSFVKLPNYTTGT